MVRRAWVIGLVAATLMAAGCVERKLTVNSNPPGARVYLNGDEKGITPVTFRFDFYGKQEFLLRKDGYRDLRMSHDVDAPIYEKPGLDILSDLGPVPFVDHKFVTFDLEPATPANAAEIMDRANEMKYRLEKKPIPAGAKSFVQPNAGTPEVKPLPEPTPPPMPSDETPKPAPSDTPKPAETPAPAAPAPTPGN